MIEPIRKPTQPTTAAGRALLGALAAQDRANDESVAVNWRHGILAIEVEARHDYQKELALCSDALNEARRETAETREERHRVGYLSRNKNKRFEVEARQQNGSALRLLRMAAPRLAVGGAATDAWLFEVRAFLKTAALPASAPPAHPEDVCGRCGGPNLATWHAPSPLWNAVMRGNDGPEPFDGIVCPRCFGELAQEAGVADHFCVTTHDAKVPLASVFGDGRVWDADRCMWVEPDAALPPSAPPALDGRISTKDRAAIIRLLRGYAFADEGMAEEAHAMADKLGSRLKEPDR